ncbi:MAG TPA: type II toxin-antitoxin system HicB family antitoxin [Dehalococcoidia bacterium]|nr:type II toxin-antitoxin system HicB family antitoxin [Dehalococcoidia bacterium]
MKYVVVLEPTGTGYSAYAPDLPGCVAAAATIEETEALIREAISEHGGLLKERGERVPEPASRAALVEVA